MKQRRFLSIILVICLVFSLSTQVLATDLKETPNTLIVDSNHANVPPYETICSIQDTLFYLYSDENVSYCSQIIDNDRIIFSYYIANTDQLFESEVYNIDSIYPTLNIAKGSDPTYLQLNQAIRSNLSNYRNGRLIADTNSDVAIAAYGTLDAAIEGEFGANYTALIKGSSNKNYNGNTYTVMCHESQTTSYTPLDSQWFAAESALTTIIAWALVGFAWTDLTLSFLTTVITTVSVNGVIKTVYAFTAQRTNVSLMHTRLVSVSGYDGTYNRSGWTRKTYFIKGDRGWVCDYSTNYNIKQTDFDDISGLMETGFQAFISSVLLGV